MPVSSKKQARYIFYLRGKYGSKSKTPKSQKWIWEDDWVEGGYKDKPEQVEENNMSKYDKLKNIIRESIDANATIDISSNDMLNKIYHTIIGYDQYGLDRDLIDDYRLNTLGNGGSGQLRFSYGDKLVTLNLEISSISDLPDKSPFFD